MALGDTFNPGDLVCISNHPAINREKREVVGLVVKVLYPSHVVVLVGTKRETVFAGFATMIMRSQRPPLPHRR